YERIGRFNRHVQTQTARRRFVSAAEIYTGAPGHQSGEIRIFRVLGAAYIDLARKHLKFRPALKHEIPVQQRTHRSGIVHANFIRLDAESESRRIRIAEVHASADIQISVSRFRREILQRCAIRSKPYKPFAVLHRERETEVAHRNVFELSQARYARLFIGGGSDGGVYIGNSIDKERFRERIEQS